MSPNETIEDLLEDSKTRGTSFHESKVTISIRPERGEQFTFYHIDDPKNNPKIRQIIQSDIGIDIVDLIIRFKPSSTVLILFVYTDGKGRDIKHGIEQIIATHRELSKYCRSNNILLVDRAFSAIIVQANSAHSLSAATISDYKKWVEKEVGISKQMVQIVKVHGNGEQIGNKIREMYQLTS